MTFVCTVKSCTRYRSMVLDSDCPPSSAHQRCTSTNPVQFCEWLIGMRMAPSDYGIPAKYHADVEMIFTNFVVTTMR